MLLSEDEYGLLPPAQRLRYDEDRLDHHARLQVVATSMVRHTVTCGRRLVLLNRHEISARRGRPSLGLPAPGRPLPSPSSDGPMSYWTGPETRTPPVESPSSTSPSRPPRPHA